MLSKTRLQSGSVLVAATAIVLAFGGCNDKETVPVNGLTEHVSVTGDSAALAAFNSKLLELEGVSFTGDAYIACKDCRRLGTANPPSSLDYYFAGEHKSKPEKFQKAKDFVNGSMPNKVTVVVDKDLLLLPPPACPPSPPAPAGCKSAPWCTDTNRCDLSFDIPNCQKCE